MKGLALAMIVGVALYLVLPLVYPPCDEALKSAALARYNKRMEQVWSADSLRSADLSVEYALDLKHELKACHCVFIPPAQQKLNQLRSTFESYMP